MPGVKPGEIGALPIAWEGIEVFSF